MTEQDRLSQSRVQNQGPEEIDRIRQIIFGPQMRNYTQQFQTIQQDLARLEQEVSRMAEQLTEQSADQTRQLQKLRRDSRQADEGIRHELRQTAQKLADEKVDRVALGELFVTLGNHLKTGGSLADLTGSSLAKLLQTFDQQSQ